MATHSVSIVLNRQGGYTASGRTAKEIVYGFGADRIQALTMVLRQILA